jgi:hypothetical protein
LEVTIIKNCIICGTLVFAIYNAQVDNTTKDDKPCAMGLQLKDSTTKDHTNVTKVDVHKPAQQDSPDADPSK